MTLVRTKLVPARPVMLERGTEAPERRAARAVEVRKRVADIFEKLPMSKLAKFTPMILFSIERVCILTAGDDRNLKNICFGRELATIGRSIG